MKIQTQLAVSYVKQNLNSTQLLHASELPSLRECVYYESMQPEVYVHFHTSHW